MTATAIFRYWSFGIDEGKQEDSECIKQLRRNWFKVSSNFATTNFMVEENFNLITKTEYHKQNWEQSGISTGQI